MQRCYHGRNPGTQQYSQLYSRGEPREPTTGWHVPERSPAPVERRGGPAGQTGRLPRGEPALLLGPAEAAGSAGRPSTSAGRHTAPGDSRGRAGQTRTATLHTAQAAQEGPHPLNPTEMHSPEEGSQDAREQTSSMNKTW